MKKIILSAVCLLPMAVMAQTGYTITGKVAKLNAPAKAYLAYRTPTEQVLDSADIVNGAFKFTGKVAEPILASLSIKHNNTSADPNKKTAGDALGIYLEDKAITVTATDSVKNASVKGSKVNDDYTALKALLKSDSDKMNALNTEYQSKSPEEKKDQAYIATLNSRAEVISNSMNEKYKEFALKNTNSFIGLVAFRSYMGYDVNPSVIEPDFNKFSAEVRGTSLGKSIASAIDNAKKTAVGSMAMDFTQNDVNGKPVKLSDFKGKYVLVDFWASWCGPCRQENPNVVSAYNKYKDKNFTILGVSLDDEKRGGKEAWLKAIADDKLTWTHVSDLKFWNNDVAKQWGIQSIPASFLIDPTGKIVGKNLRGEELTNKLEELLVKGASK